MPDLATGGAIGAIGGGLGSLASGIGNLFGGGGDDSGVGDAIIQAAQIAANEARAAREAAAARLQPGTDIFKPSVERYGGLLNLPGYTAYDPTETLRATPGYEFARSEGLNALDRQAAARGGLLSGPQSKALVKYGTGLADQTYQNYLGNLMNMVKTGQNSAAQTGMWDIQTGQSLGNYAMQGGQGGALNAMNAERARQSSYGNIFGGLGALSTAIPKAYQGVSNWYNQSSGGYNPWAENYTSYGNPGSYANYDTFDSSFYFAKGGSIPANKLAIVGEEGPEVFVPKTDGYILPNNALTPEMLAKIRNNRRGMNRAY